MHHIPGGDVCLFLRGPDPVEDGLHFAEREGFSAVLVAHLLQLVPQHVVAAINHEP